MDELGARRAGRREANLRGLNERIADAQHQAGNGFQRLRLVCECSLIECEDAIDVPTPVFEDARDAGARYIVSPGHVLQEVEHAVEQGDGWVIVEKVGSAARGVMEVQE